MATPLARLREVIQKALDDGESQAALGKRLGVTQPTVHGWLNEDGLDPKASVLEAVARVLGINGHWLLTGQGDKRALSAGADVVFAFGVQTGLLRAEEAVRTLRATSADATEASDRAAAERLLRAAMADVAAASPPREPARRRKSGE